ncbi:PD-(D/E)XK nuclease family protein [Caldivirga sp. MU80]|uniref:PD-(D/E)XK nuclease family protein n=1 Tax=Caldivirga sp. MU80 TaxID=1650354 RepID=UPI00082AD036|nr:DUF3782 domain-containing protein [Caldivirga sp. MU80]
MSVDLRGLLLRLLREDEEFRLAVMGLLGYSDVKSSVDRLVEAVSELAKAVKSHDERLTRLENAVEELTRAVKAHEDRLTRVEDRLTRLENAVEELTKAVKEQSKAIEELAKIVKSHEDRLAKVEEAIKAFDRRLMALGARWGVESEEAFRNAMMGVVEGILGVATVGKWVYFDKDGVVYGHPSQVEVDVAIRDGTHILIEIKASASSGDALEFSRVGKLYETVTGIKPRLVLVTPFIDDRGLEAARKLGIEVYTSV